MSLDKLDRQIDELVQQRYLMSNRMFRPLFPWVFVRVLPKEHMVGSIYTQGKQNKPVHEGIVIATWKSRDQDTVSELVPGDHVLFNHFAGATVEGFPYDKISGAGYRCVKECSWTIDKEGGIFAKVEYQLPSKPLGQFIDEDIPAGSTYWEIGDAIEKVFILLPRHVGSITLSGK